MSSKLIAFTLLALLALSPIYIYSQLRIDSPYSRYGIGEMYDNSNLFNKGMAGLSYSQMSAYNINSKNPASYSSIDTGTFVFDFSIKSSYNNLKTSTSSSQSNYFNLDYFKMGFPIAKWYKASVGLNPFSTVGYDVLVTKSIDSIGTANFNYLGDGGFNTFYIGNSFQIFKNFSIGANLNYIFGSINYRKTSTLPDLDYAFNFRSFNTTTIKSIYLEYGLQYAFNLKNENRIQLGLTYTNRQGLSASRSATAQTFTESDAGSVTVKDTIYDNETGSGKIYMPQKIGGGISIVHSNKWSLGFDITSQDWDSYEFFENSDSLKSTMNYTLGGWVKSGNINYRAGIKYYESNIYLKNTMQSGFGISFGMSLPLQRKSYFSNIEFGLEYSNLGTTENNLIRQEMVNFYMGLAIRNIWFQRPKYK